MDPIAYLFMISAFQYMMAFVCLIPALIPGFERFCDETLGCWDVCLVPFKAAFIMAFYATVNCSLAYVGMIPA